MKWAIFLMKKIDKMETKLCYEESTGSGDWDKIGNSPLLQPKKKYDLYVLLRSLGRMKEYRL